MPTGEAPSTFVSFEETKELLAKLRRIEGSGQELEPLFKLVAERLGRKAYDRSAFVFILIELIYEFQEIYSGPLGDLLSRSVLALTEDSELAEAAVQAFEEVTASLEASEPEDAPNGGGEAEAEPRSAGKAESGAESAIDDEFLEEAFPIPDTGPLGPYVSRSKSPDQERLMVGLQEFQKQVADLGLSARMSIDMTLSRPSRESVSHALREVSALRAVLRSFDALLAESEERILEEIGILEKD